MIKAMVCVKSNMLIPSLLSSQFTKSAGVLIIGAGKTVMVTLWFNTAEQVGFVPLKTPTRV